MMTMNGDSPLVSDVHQNLRLDDPTNEANVNEQDSLLPQPRAADGASPGLQGSSLLLVLAPAVLAGCVMQNDSRS